MYVGTVTNRSEGVERKGAGRLLGHHLGNGQAGRGGGRGRVAHVQQPGAKRAGARVEHKVVHQVALGVQCLGAHPRRAPGWVVNFTNTKNNPSANQSTEKCN